MIGKMIRSLVLGTSLIALIGCDNGRELARMQAEVNRAASELVTRDAQARQDMMKMQAAIDKERRKVSSLEEAYRKRVTKERTDPVVAEAILHIAGVFLCLLPLVIAIKLLSGDQPVTVDPVVDAYLLDEQLALQPPDEVSGDVPVAASTTEPPKRIGYRDLDALVEDRLAKG